MLENVIEYAYSEKYTKTLIFVPGYSGGLEVSTISSLIDYFVESHDVNVYGINMSYHEDTIDLFDGSQKRLIAIVNEICSKVPNIEVVLIGKSLGGSLALFNQNELKVSKIVVLGCSIVLGWPQRISLLKAENPKIPDYKKEWEDALESLDVPTLILSGGVDDLTDNDFLLAMTEKNKNIMLKMVENANHNLEDATTGEQKVLDYVSVIHDFSN